MKTVRSRATLALVVLTAGILAADAALARGGSSGGHSRGARSPAVHHHHHHPARVAVIGAAIWPANHYYYRPYVPPAAPLYYIEHPTEAGGEFLYCRATNAYFPYVWECLGGWERVPSQPPQ